MSKIHLATAFVLVALFISCKNEKPAPVAPVTTIGHAHFDQSEGSDCDKPDSVQTNCASIHFVWPKVETGPDSLQKSVAKWAREYLVAIIDYPEADTTPLAATLEEGARHYFAARTEFMKDAEGSPMSNWIAESYDTVLLNDGKYLTLSINGETYQGGAHGSHTAAVATFDNASGKILTWDDIVTDTLTMQAIAEKKFKIERADLFEPTDGMEPFKFDNEMFAFQLPVSFGLTATGIYCYYQHYEVTPYAFGATVFEIPFSELKGILKIKK